MKLFNGGSVEVWQVDWTLVILSSCCSRELDLDPVTQYWNCRNCDKPIALCTVGRMYSAYYLGLLRMGASPVVVSLEKENLRVWVESWVDLPTPSYQIEVSVAVA